MRCLRVLLAAAVVVVSSVPALAVEGASVDHDDYRAHYELPAETDVSFPEVGVVRDQRSTCFGTAIAPNVVLTSSACVAKWISSESASKYFYAGDPPTIFGTSLSKTRIDCVPVGDQSARQVSLSICRSADAQLDFAVLARPIAENVELVNVMGKLCGSSSFDIASRIVTIHRIGEKRWTSPGIGPCAGDQGAPAFRLVDRREKRNQIAGVIAGSNTTNGDSGILLVSVQLDTQTRQDFEMAARELGVEICGVNYFQERICNFRPIPEDDPEPGKVVNALSFDTQGISHSAADTYIDLMERACKFVTPNNLKQMC